MKENIAFVFPGNGSQYSGMCRDIYGNPVVRSVFEEVSDSAGRNIARICLNPEKASELSKFENSALAILAHSVAIARLIEDKFKQPLYSMSYAMVGHSVGQYSALCCAGSINLTSAVKLISARAQYSTKYAPAGGMVAIIGLSHAQVQQVINSVRLYGRAYIANHNSVNQFVVSGEESVLPYVVDAANQAGAIKVVRLDIAVPAHCELMAPAAQGFSKDLRSVNITEPQTRIFSNKTSDLIQDPFEIKKNLVDHITCGVRWADIVKKFPAHNITCAYELGPKNVLTRLINRASVNCHARQTGDMKNINIVLQHIESILSR